MTYPKNYRWDPFNDVSTAINIIERRRIPGKSPYVIRLNEVPLKAEPSTMSVKVITNIDSSNTPSYGATFTEVAATPSAGQFRPDYSTGANGDNSWNAGLVEFSSSNASTWVEISYQGTGTLAGVSNNIIEPLLIDRGSGYEGDKVFSANETISGLKNYKSVYIKAGVTVTVDRYCHIKCLESFTNEGTLTAEGKGAPGGAGAVRENDRPTAPKAGGAGISSVGGAGGSLGNTAIWTGGAGGGRIFNDVSISFSNVISIIKALNGYAYGAGGGGGGCYTSDDGRAGGAGGAGGGSIVIICKEFFNSGTVTARGSKGANGVTDINTRIGCGGGGGGGGSIIISATNIVKEGTLSVAGGGGGSPAGDNASEAAVGAPGGNGLLVKATVPY